MDVSAMDISGFEVGLACHEWDSEIGTTGTSAAAANATFHAAGKTGSRLTITPDKLL